ncbi:MAG: RHS repeat protein, partial [Myxococcales bacterium]|nr:RHS repeat protein [Myxococcales bacterium]
IEGTLEEQQFRHTTLFERDAFGRVVVERQDDRVIRFTYDAQNRRLSRELFDGTVTRYGFDREDALCEIEHAGRKLSYQRDAAGREIGRTEASGAVAFLQELDPMDRIIEQRVTSVGSELATPITRRYQYDRAGRLSRSEDARWGISSYQYDTAGNLMEARSHGRRERFAYDPAGAIVGALERVGEPTAKWKLGPGNRLLETTSHAFTFDKRGRRSSKRSKVDKSVTDYAWDVRDRLREIRQPDGSRVRMVYDAFGRRIRKVVSQGEREIRAVELVWDGDVICAELNGRDGSRSFAHDPRGFVPLLQREGNEVFAVIVDHHGIPRELVDSAGRVAWAATFSAFGKLVEESWPRSVEASEAQPRCPFRLLGQYADDETGLTMTRHRYFDPEVGRWCSPDPLGIRGSRDLNGWNGAPTVELDPLGLTNEPEGGDPHHPPGLTRSDHAEIRNAEGRPVPNATNDLRNARDADIFVQEDDDRFVVRGPRGREHIIEQDGTHVTSLERSNAAHLGRVRSGDRRPATAEEAERARSLVR